jgi:hypothetical protein
MTEADRALLLFEEAHPGRSNQKAGMIRPALGITPTRYYQRLLALVETREVVEAFPQLSSRIMRQRDRDFDDRLQRRLHH